MSKPFLGRDPVSIENERRPIWGSIVEAWYNLFELVILNLLWIVTSLLVVTIPPALGGLFYATHELAWGRPASGETFFHGFKEYFWVSWRWALTNILVLGLVVANFLFYERVPTSWAPLMQGVVMGMGFIWLWLQTVTLPLLLEQEDRRVRVALRNSLVLVLRRPGLTLSLLLALFVLALISTFLQIPWVIVSASLCAFLANRVTLIILNDMEVRTKAPPRP